VLSVVGVEGYNLHDGVSRVVVDKLHKVQSVVPVVLLIVDIDP